MSHHQSSCYLAWQCLAQCAIRNRFLSFAWHHAAPQTGGVKPPVRAIPQRRPFPPGGPHSERNGWLPFHLSWSHFFEGITCFFIHEQHPWAPLSCWCRWRVVSGNLVDSHWISGLLSRQDEASQPWWWVRERKKESRKCLCVCVCVTNIFRNVFLSQAKSSTRYFCPGSLQQSRQCAFLFFRL